MIEQISLAFIGGGSDKIYQAQIIQTDGGFLVNFQYGRRGSTLTSGTKTSTPVSLEAAQKIYSKLVAEKRSKGYDVPEAFGLPAVAGNTTGISVSIPTAKTSFGHLPQLLNPITEEEALRLLSDDDYILQEKHDGERRMASKDHSGVLASNRKGEVIATTLEIATGLASAPSCVLDGEQVGNVFWVFDMLQINGQNLKELPYLLRLASLKAIRENNAVQVVLTAHTTTEKTSLFDALYHHGKEGVVFKRKDASYKPGRPNSGGDQLKFKFYETATCRVRTINTQRSVEIELKDGDGYVAKGNVTIPPNHPIPTAASLVEVRYLYAYPGAGSLYQPTFIRVRDDVGCDDVKSLKYKS